MSILLIFSGGMDSATLLYDLLNQGEHVECLTIDYKQRHRQEIVCAQKICTALNVAWDVVDLSALNRFLIGSSQSDPVVRVPYGRYDEPSMKITVVPNRNMFMLACAGAAAIGRKLDRLMYAAHAGDHAIYPDCRPEFVEAMNVAFGLCDWHKLKLEAPYLEMTKGDICKRGIELNVPYEKTWTCYVGAGWPCGQCGACQERAEAFEFAGIKDPLLLRP